MAMWSQMVDYIKTVAKEARGELKGERYFDKET